MSSSPCQLSWNAPLSLGSSPIYLCPVGICAAFPSYSPVHHCPVDICATYPSHSPAHHHLVDICATFPSHSPVHHRPVDICATYPSHSPIHLRPVDICATFLSHSPIHHRPVDICAAFPSHSPVHHPMVDICAAFPSHSLVYQIDIHNGFHHVDLRDDIYKHPNHNLRFPVPRYLMARGTRSCRQESSLTRRGYCPLSPPGQCIVLGGGGLAQQCPSISLTLAIGIFMTPSMPIHCFGQARLLHDHS